MYIFVSRRPFPPTGMMEFVISLLKGSHYRRHQSQFAITFRFSKCQHGTLLWVSSVNTAGGVSETVTMSRSLRITRENLKEARRITHMEGNEREWVFPINLSSFDYLMGNR